MSKTDERISELGYEVIDTRLPNNIVYLNKKMNKKSAFNGI